jgi:hypothetical protein
MRGSFANCQFYRTDHFPGRKRITAIAVRKDIPHTHINLPPLVSIEAAGVCILIGNSEMSLAAVYKAPGHAWNDADIELLSFKHKLLLAGDLNAKHPFWNIIVSNPLGAKLLNLLHINYLKFQHYNVPAVSASKCRAKS